MMNILLEALATVRKIANDPHGDRELQVENHCSKRRVFY